MTDKKPCTRCLLEEAGNADMSVIIKERISSLSPDDRADDSEYKQRLGICLGCEWLRQGICAKCGCYVELRAARKNSKCPSATPKW